MKASCPRSTLLTKSPFWLYWLSRTMRRNWHVVPPGYEIGWAPIGMEFFNQTSYQQGTEFTIMVQFTLSTMQLPDDLSPRWFQCTLSGIIQESNSYFYASDDCQMPNSAISTIPLLVSLHLRFMTPWSRLLRCRCENWQQLQGPDLMPKPVWGETSTAPTWPDPAEQLAWKTTYK